MGKREELIGIIQRCCSGGVVKSWGFLPKLVDAIMEWHEKKLT